MFLGGFSAMTARRDPVWPALLALLLGSAAQLQQAQLWPLGWYVGLALLAGVFWLASAHGAVAAKHAPTLLLRGLGVCLLAFALTGWRASVFVDGALDSALEGLDITVSGVVATMPQPFENGQRFRFEVSSSTRQGQPVRLPGKLELAWYARALTSRDDVDAGATASSAPAPALRAGQRWQFVVRLKAPHGAVNPHGFDLELWQWEQGVQATGYVRNGRDDPPPELLAQTWQHPLERWRQRVRERIYAQVLEPRAAGLIAALVVGDQGAIERADWNVFRATGVAHLMSISGLHITLFAWLAAALLGRLWHRSQRLCLAWPAANAALLGGVLLAGGYALFSGWGVPAQRTVLMLCALAVLRLQGARWPWPMVWLLAAAVVVAVDPWALLQAGFWLSFVAVGVLFASDSRAVGAHSTRAGGYFYSMFREQGVITLALLPLTLLLFGQVSLVGLLANLLAIPWVTLLLTPLAMLGVLLAPLWSAAAWTAGLLSDVLQWLASWPWAVWWVAQAPLWAGAAGLLGGVLLVLRLPLSLRACGVPLLLPVLLWQAPLPPPGEFELLAVDVGQGSAVLLRTAQHALLFDAGPRYSSDSDAGHRVLVPLLHSLNVRLDTLILSHRDSDHAGGGATLRAMQPGAALLTSMDEALHGVADKRCVAGQRWRWDGVDFELLHPQAGDYSVVKKPNAMSCVLRVSSAAHSALLTGDLEQAQERQLVALGAPVRADVLVVPHHGSKTSSSAEFLDAVQARFALVQSGYRNRFGHPAGPVLVRYAQRHIAVIDTPHCGAITWQSWRPAALQCERQRKQRYWFHQVPAR